MTNQEIVTRFLNGFNNPQHIGESWALLAGDYKFKNPMVALGSKTEFIALATEMAKVLTGVKLISTAENGNWVATHYIFQSAIPGLENNHAAEWFRLEKGIIRESVLIYDASQWRKVYENIQP